MGPLVPLFWTSGDVCPGFQSQGGFPCLDASLPVHNRFLRFTSGVTPADCIEVTWQPSLFDPCTCSCVCRHWWRFGAQIHNRPCHTYSTVNQSATPAQLPLVSLAPHTPLCPCILTPLTPLTSLSFLIPLTPLVLSHPLHHCALTPFTPNSLLAPLKPLF